MKVTLSKAIDAAYIYLTSKPNLDSPFRTYPCDPIEVGGEINLDFDSSGHLVGIEVMDASRLLPADILKNADVIG